VNRLLRDLVVRYLRTAVRRPILAVGALSVLFLLALQGARSLTVDSRLEALLPADTPSARANRELAARLVGSSPLYLLVRGQSLTEARAAVKRLHALVSAWPETDWAMYKREPEYFAKHRLLYLPADKLLEFDEQIDERRRWEECERVPGCVNLDTEAPPLPTEDDLGKAFDENPDLRSLVALFGDEPLQFAKARPTGAAPSSERTPGAGSQTSDDGELGELCDSEHNVCTVQASLSKDASDLAFAQEILARSEALFAQVKAELPESRLEFAVSGQFRNAPMMQRMAERDLTKTSLLSLALVLALVMLQFRGVRTLLLLAVPVLFGIGWTAGVVSLLVPSLNLISAFTLAVLMGIGIDFGVHLLTHYAAARGRGEPMEVALHSTFRSLGASLAVAAGTTMCGFAALAVASFRGFSQMGPIAALGVALTFLASVLLFPPLLALLDRTSDCKFALRRYGLDVEPGLRRFAKPVATFGVVLTVLGVVTASGILGSGVEFEYDFGKLRPSTVSHGIPWSGTLHGTTRTAVYLLADDQAALSEVAAELRANRPEKVVAGDKPFLIIPGAFVPPDQPARLAALRKLSDTLTRAKEAAAEETRADVESFIPLTQVSEPVTVEGMPRWVRAWLTERDGRFGTLGILYSDLSGSDARQMEVLAGQLEEWRKRFPRVRFASPTAQLGEVTPRLRQEGPFVLALALLGVCLGTLLVSRSLARTALVLVPLLVMVSVAGLCMAALEIRVNLYNLLVFPLAFGIGIDGAVYVAWALGAKNQSASLRSAFRAVLGSTLTTIAGFASLCLSSNPGVVSIGTLAVLMLTVSLGANLLWLPATHFALPRVPLPPE
jgi:predicted RND superfamily exporter protein